MQCRCQFVQEKVCVSREQYAQVRKLVLGRLDNASPCVCVYVCVFFKECVPRTICACVTCGATSSMDGRTTHTQTHRHRHTHTHRQPHNHAPNHTDTPYHTPTYPNPPWWNTAGGHTSWRQKGFFECRTRKGFFRVEIRFFFEVGPIWVHNLSEKVWIGHSAVKHRR